MLQPQIVPQIEVFVWAAAVSKFFILFFLAIYVHFFDESVQ